MFGEGKKRAWEKDRKESAEFNYTYFSYEENDCELKLWRWTFWWEESGQLLVSLFMYFVVGLCFENF